MRDKFSLEMNLNVEGKKLSRNFALTFALENCGFLNEFRRNLSKDSFHSLYFFVTNVLCFGYFFLFFLYFEHLGLTSPVYVSSFSHMIILSYTNDDIIEESFQTLYRLCVAP